MFHNLKTSEITRQSKFEEEYVELAGYRVPLRQTVHSRLSGDRSKLVELRLSNLCVL